MSLLDTYLRVSRSRPCPVCDHADWCLISRDDPASRAVCARVESPRRWGEAGWLHTLRADVPDARRAARAHRVVRVAVPAAAPDLADRAARFSAAVRPGALARLSEHLGLTAESLRRLGIGWTGSAWSFPMTDAAGRVRGVRLRFPDGTKLSVKGGREGLFVPAGLRGAGPLLIAEGATDAAALLDLGAEAIGRPSCRGGARLVIDYLRAHPRGEAVVVADADGPGRAGARDLAFVLAPLCPQVRVLAPPAKDARAWLLAGASPQDLLAALHAAEPVGVRVAVRGAAR